MKRVSVVGGSMGGGAAAQASVDSDVGDIDDLILLAHSPVSMPQNLKGRKLFMVSKGDGAASSGRKQHAAAPEPKKLVVLNGNVHAQHLFRTEQSDALLDHMVQWLQTNEQELKQ